MADQTTGIKPEDKPEMKHKLLVSILNFLSLAIPGYLARIKKACFAPRVAEVPKEKPSDLPKVPDSDMTSHKLLCNPWMRLHRNVGSVAPLIFLNPKG